MTSYQKLKAKCQKLQSQVDIFKNALTIYRTEPKMEIKPNGDCFLTAGYKIILNKIDYETQIKLTLWVINNIDKKIVKTWLKRKSR